MLEKMNIVGIIWYNENYDQDEKRNIVIKNLNNDNLQDIIINDEIVGKIYNSDEFNELDYIQDVIEKFPEADEVFVFRRHFSNKSKKVLHVHYHGVKIYHNKTFLRSIDIDVFRISKRISFIGNFLNEDVVY